MLTLINSSLLSVTRCISLLHSVQTVSGVQKPPVQNIQDLPLWGQSDQIVKTTTHIHTVPSLGIAINIPPYLNVSSRCGV